MIFDSKISDLYVVLYEMTTNILEEKLKYFSENNGKEVDIYALAKAYEIKIVKQNLESSQDIFSQEVLGYLDSFYEKTIYINDTAGDYSKRYGVAHDIGHYLVKKEKHEDDQVFACYYATPRLPKNAEEQICDIIASFLLMPVSTVLDLMNEYISEVGKLRKYEATTYTWLEYLGEKLHIADYYTGLCFQNIRYLCAILYERAQEMKDEDIEKGSIYEKIKTENVERLFR